ncbi:hypothetical protein RRG08_030800 [Elysia crispata]|uniref:Uncharacterized protein n=1 Tax=Elysia crispata TaxID=231223 RepID=A0AAE1CXT7_9GAST|nr:hypothetical protein RRG08_030800 [Elysia crispata]
MVMSNDSRYQGLVTSRQGIHAHNIYNSTQSWASTPTTFTTRHSHGNEQRFSVSRFGDITPGHPRPQHLQLDTVMVMSNDSLYQGLVTSRQGIHEQRVQELENIYVLPG